MTEQKEMTTQKKQELKTAEEKTVPGRFFVPNTDIVETDDALIVAMDMPGVSKERVDIKLEKRVLSVEGHIDIEPYKKLKPVYTEYNLGNWSRSFTLSSEIDQQGIEASMTDGVLMLTLPKVKEMQPKSITVS